MVRGYHTRIASRSVLGKRKRSGYGVRAFKRRRIGVNRRSTTYTTKSGAGRSFFFRRRRISGRRFRRSLFRNTQWAAHYRSIGTNTGSLSTPTGSATVNTSFVNALDNGTAAFWVNTGGIQPIDTGVTVPLFRGDITIRGGILGIRCYNDGAYPMHIRIWLVFTKDPWASNSANYNLTGVPLSWDPTCVPDYHRDFSIIKSYEFLIEALNMVTVEFRMRPTKVDQLRWSTDVCRPYWLFAVGDGDPTGQDNGRIVSYFNVSFSGDAIGAS